MHVFIYPRRIGVLSKNHTLVAHMHAFEDMVFGVWVLYFVLMYISKQNIYSPRIGNSLCCYDSRLAERDLYLCECVM